MTKEALAGKARASVVTVCRSPCYGGIRPGESRPTSPTQRSFARRVTQCWETCTVTDFANLLLFRPPMFFTWFVKMP
jgi:hypothetical protein